MNPQPASGGYTCVVSTSTYAADTVNCSNSAALAANSQGTLNLIVSIADSVTATNFDNKAKVAGGGDPNKATLATTGAITGCVASNEGQFGGGTTFSGSPSYAGCAFENTLLTRQANLSVSKTNGTTSLVAGSTTNYTVTFNNLGPSSASGAKISDTPSTGLSNCSVLSCTPAGNPTPAVCPSITGDLLVASGTTIPSFPSKSSLTFVVRCGVTATGF